MPQIRTTILTLLTFLSLFGWITSPAYHFHITPNTAMVGRPMLVTYDGQKPLSELARDYGVGLDNLKNANGLTQHTWPKRGTSLVVPSQYILPPLQHRGIVINLPEKRLYFYPNQNEVYVFPVAIGALGKDSPIQTFKIRDKRKDPVWTLPKQAKEELIKYGK